MRRKRRMVERVSPPHADAQIDLQGLLHRIYDAAGYEDCIYRGQPQPQLNAEDATWAGQFVPGGATPT